MQAIRKKHEPAQAHRCVSDIVEVEEGRTKEASPSVH